MKRRKRQYVFVSNEARNAVIEECAKVAEQYDNYTVDGRPSAVGAVIAAAIRGLAETGALASPTSEPAS